MANSVPIRSAAASALALAALALPGCAARDPHNAVARAEVGAVAGATLGAGLGAAIAINPALGAAIGVGAGALGGAIAGVMMSEPPIVYGPVPPRDTAVAPGFYDTWPPGYSTPPIGSRVPPPPRPG